MPQFTKAKRKEYLLIFLILLFSFAIRIINIKVGNLPVFADEAIYVRWSQVMRAEPTLRFLPQFDGKQPLFMWATIPFFKVFEDPLFASRLLSVLCGVVTTLGVYLLARTLFSKSRLYVALVASTLYAVSPYALFFDSMALADSMLAMFGIWTLLLSVLVVRTGRYDMAMLTGFTLGGALLTKSPALFFAISVFVCAILTTKLNIKNLAKTFFLLAIIYLIGYGMYNILRLGPNFHMIALRNQDYVFPVSHLLENPKDPFIPHLGDIINWMWILLPSGAVILSVIGVGIGLKNYKKESLILLWWILFPLLAQAEYAKTFTARYVFFVMPFIIVFAGASYMQKRTNVLLKIGFGLTVLYSLYFNYLLIFNIQKAKLPKNERSGYLEEWTSGYGIKEASLFIRDLHAKYPDQKIIVGTEGYFGTLPDGLQIYLNDLPEITIIGVGLDLKEVPKALVESVNYGNRTFLLINSTRLKADPQDINLKLVLSFGKALREEGLKEYNINGPQETLYLFEVEKR